MWHLMKMSLAGLLLVLPFLTLPSVFAQQMDGNQISMSITPSTFNPSTDKNVTLAFTPTPSQDMMSVIEPRNKLEHIDYIITVSKDGKQVFTNPFHTHSGVLTLVFSPSTEPVNVSGGESDPNHTTTGPFYISGPVFDANGNYQVDASIVGVEFIPLANSVDEKFNMDVVPEFGTIAAPILILAIVGAVILSRQQSRIRF